jgi:hypothetical protein
MVHEEGRDENLRHAARLMRAFVALHGALRRHRADAAKAGEVERRRPAADTVRATRTLRAADGAHASFSKQRSKSFCGASRRRNWVGLTRGESGLLWNFERDLGRFGSGHGGDARAAVG